MSNKDTDLQSKNLQLDQKKRFHITLPTGEKEIIELTDGEIDTVENWFHLVGKHKLRLDIMNVLQIYSEMNITQLSQNVEHSKSTVARHLKIMEQDGLLESRIAGPEEFEPGKIPPRLYRRNDKLLKVVQYAFPGAPEPKDPTKRTGYYRKQLDSYREHIRQYISFYKKTELIFKMIENNLDDTETARELWIKYIEEQITPARLTMNMLSISEKYFLQVLDEYKKFLNNVIKILAVQNVDPEVKKREFTGLFALLPIKDMFDLYREEKKRKTYEINNNQ